MLNLKRDLVFLILQFCNEEGYEEAAHMLESQSGSYFDMKYFEETLLGGKWDEAERYLSGFTTLVENRYSTKIYFEIRKQNFFEAIDSNCRAKAFDILTKDLQVFAKNNEELFNEMQHLLTFDNIRDHEALSNCGGTMSMRKCMTKEIKKLIKANQAFCGKLKCPKIESHRLIHLINQSLSWQHTLCNDPRPRPVIETLFIDHVCELPEIVLLRGPAEDNLEHEHCEDPCRNPDVKSLFADDVGEMQGYLTLSQSTGDNLQPSQATSHPIPTSSAEPSASNPAIEVTDYPSGTQKMSFPALDEVLAAIDSDTDPGESHISTLDLPSTVALTLNEESSPTSMDFHPIQQTLLLVGTSVGAIGLWDVSSGTKLVSKNFRVWDLEACSMALKEALGNDSYVSINCIRWSPDGSTIGVAYSKHIVQLYFYNGDNKIHKQLEIDAHLGSVNDLAFFSPHNGEPFVTTCGDDKTVKVWDPISGNLEFTFEDHGAPVNSVCPHPKDVHFVFSTSVDGKVKVWLYDSLASSVDFDTSGLGLGCTKLAQSADDHRLCRLFSCGIGRQGKPFLAEWNGNHGTIRRLYDGLGKNPLSVVHFDTTKNQFLAVGDEHVVKFWDMDDPGLLKALDAGGGLPANPLLRFNKEGTLLAVTANENSIKILASDSGLRLLQQSKNGSTDAAAVEAETSRKDGDPMEEEASETTGEASGSEKAEGLVAISIPSQCQSLKLKLSALVERSKISRLMYTNTGDAILALTSTGVLLVWKWPKDLNSTGKATTKVRPHVWQPKSFSELLTIDLTGTNPEEAISCFDLSKDDLFLITESEGKITLFNMETFESTNKFMPPQRAATCVALHPTDVHKVAIGMEDGKILLYNLFLDEVTVKLGGHRERVSTLTFSNTLNVLVSAGADAQIVVWDAAEWQKQSSKLLQIPDGKELSALSESDTFIQFDKDELHFLAIHKTHLAVYEAKELACVKKWVPSFSADISHATYSGDSQMVYASFVDGTVAILDASTFELHCQINPSDYLPADISYTVYPLAIAAHPQKLTQFSVGLSNGEVCALEPPGAEGKWGVSPLV